MMNNIIYAVFAFYTSASVIFGQNLRNNNNAVNHLVGVKTNNNVAQQQNPDKWWTQWHNGVRKVNKTTSIGLGLN